MATQYRMRTFTHKCKVYYMPQQKRNLVWADIMDEKDAIKFDFFCSEMSCRGYITQLLEEEQESQHDKEAEKKFAETHANKILTI